MAVQSAEIRAEFERWLAVREEGAAVATVRWAGETLLVDAGWGGGAHRLVVRLAQGVEPSASYEARSQFLTLQRLRAQLYRPAVPPVLWCESSAEPVGAPFFVMTRVDGRTLGEHDSPYTFGSWLTEATATDRQRIQRATVEQLARVHAAAPSDFSFLDQRRAGETALAAHLRRTIQRYRSTDQAVPLIERGLDWLRRHWPEESAPVVSWGNARVDNVVYRGLVPVALVDWAAATLAPRELDLGSLIFVHRYLDEQAQASGLPGVPDFLRPADVASAYAEITGYRPSQLRFYTIYAAVQHAVAAQRNGLPAKMLAALAALLDEPDQAPK